MKPIRLFFERLGVDWIQFTSLYVAHLKIDFRAPARRGASGRGLWYSMIFYAFFASFVSLSFHRLFDLFGFSALTLSVSSVILILAVIVEFNEIILSPNDIEIFGFRPVSDRTYFWVKFANLLTYVTLLGLALNLPVAVVGTVLYADAPVFYGVLYLLVAWITHSSLTMVLVSFYGFIIQRFNYEKVKDVFAYVQIALSFLVFGGYQVLIRLLPEGAAQRSLLASWNALVPTFWFAGLLHLFLHPGMVHFQILAFLAVALTYLGYRQGISRLSLEYSDLLLRISMSGKARIRAAKGPGKLAALERFILRDPEEEAGYFLFRRYLGRNRTLRAGYFALLGFPAVMILIALTEKDFSDPFVEINGSSIGLLQIVSFAAFLVVQLIIFSDHWQAAWIFYAAPVRNFGKIYLGAAKALTLSYAAPLTIILLVTLIWRMPFFHAAGVAAVSLVNFVALFSVLMWFVRDLPLSRKRERGHAAFRTIAWILLFPVLALFGLVEYFLFRFPSLLLPGFVFLLLLAFINVRMAVMAIDRKIRKREFAL